MTIKLIITTSLRIMIKLNPLKKDYKMFCNLNRIKLFNKKSHKMLNINLMNIMKIKVINKQKKINKSKMKKFNSYSQSII